MRLWGLPGEAGGPVAAREAGTAGGCPPFSTGFGSPSSRRCRRPAFRLHAPNSRTPDARGPGPAGPVIPRPGETTAIGPGPKPPHSSTATHLVAVNSYQPVAFSPVDPPRVVQDGPCRPPRPWGCSHPTPDRSGPRLSGYDGPCRARPPFQWSSPREWRSAGPSGPSAGPSPAFRWSSRPPRSGWRRVATG